MTTPAGPRPRGVLGRMATNTVAANVFMAILLVGGLLSLPRIRQEVFPEFDLETVLVQVTYPGASPSEVEQGVLLAIEEAVRGLDGVKEVRSTAYEGAGLVTIELLLGTNTQRALSDVQSAVGRITSFPVDIERPVVSVATMRGEAISLVIHGQASEASLRALAERVRDELLQNPGITTIELAGVRPLEIDIEAPEDRLRAYGLRIEDIANAVRQASVEVPSGAVKTARGEVLLRTAERRDSADGFADIVVRAQPDGTMVRVRDVATVTDGFRELDQYATYDGERAVMVKVFRVGDQTPLGIAETVKEYAAAHASDLPPGVHFAIWNDRSEIYAQRIDLLRRNAIMGLLLVLVTLGLFLEVRLAFWVTLGIPVSFLGTLLFLPATGVTINMISLFAFILTLGIVVDDAIVVSEAVFHHRQAGMAPLAAAIRGVREVALPVTFSVLTTVVAFTPLLFVPGTMGKFFMNIPVIVIIVLLLSLFESLFILPAHLAHGREGARARGPLAAVRAVQDGFQRLLQRFVDRVYSPVQARAVAHRYLTVAIGVSVLLSALGLVAGGRLAFTFFPKIDSDIVRATVTMPFGTAVQDTERVQRRLVEAGLALSEELGGGRRVRRGLFSVVGGTGTGGGGGPRGGGQSASGSHLAEVAIQFVPSDERPFTARQFAEAWRERVGEVPGVDTLTFDYSTGGPGSAAIDFQLSHRDIEALEHAARLLAARLGEYAGVRDVDDGFAEGKQQIDFTLRAHARTLGITEGDLARQLRNAYYGAEAVRQQRGRDELRVVVRRPREERESLAYLERLLLRTPQGGEVPLGEAAELRSGRAYTQIQRVDGRRVMHVTSDVREGANANQIVGQVTKDVLPSLQREVPGLAVTMGGDQRNQQESLGALGRGFLLALIAMYALMAIPLRSYVQPIVIMTAIPFSFVGAILGHLIMRFDLSLMSAMGLVALAGVAVNDSLVYIDAANELRRGGMEAEDAAKAAGVRRFRPIMLTSLTTFFGLIPMILEPSVQARFLIPMALSLGFGVLFCTFTTLLIVPSLYMILEDGLALVRRTTAWWRGDDDAPGSGARGDDGAPGSGARGGDAAGAPAAEIPSAEVPSGAE
jgi:multidrug efflux pump subunit AcrB